MGGYLSDSNWASIGNEFVSSAVRVAERRILPLVVFGKLLGAVRTITAGSTWCASTTDRRITLASCLS
jgi:hypothetical protein